MKPILSKLTYANVVSTLCLFLILGGGSAVAANYYINGKNLINNSVDGKKLKTNSVPNQKLQNDTITSSKIKNKTLTLNDFSPVTQSMLRGDDGVDGRPGAAGPRGLPGPKGDRGEKGEKGAQGAQGIVGPPGADGAAAFGGRTITTISSPAMSLPGQGAETTTTIVCPNGQVFLGARLLLNGQVVSSPGATEFGQIGGTPLFVSGLPYTIRFDVVDPEKALTRNGITVKPVVNTTIPVVPPVGSHTYGLVAYCLDL